MKKRIFKKLVMTTLVGLLTMSLTGCGEDIKEFALTLNSDIISRMEENQHMFDTLKKNGLISEKTYAEFSTNMANLRDIYSSEMTKLTSESNFKEGVIQDANFVNNIKYMSYLDGADLYHLGNQECFYANPGDKNPSVITSSAVWTNGNGNVYCTTEKLSEHIITNYLDLYKNQSKLGMKNTYNMPNGNDPKYATNVYGREVIYLGDPTSGDAEKTGKTLVSYENQPLWANPEGRKTTKYTQGKHTLIDIVPESVNGDLSDRLACPIYVLDPNLTTLDGENALDEVIAAIEKAVTVSNTGDMQINEISENLKKYFVPTGQNLLDIAVENGLGTVETIGDEEVVEFKLVRPSQEQKLNGTKHGVGYDLIVKQEGCPVFTVGFMEFDPEAFELLYELYGLNDNKYIIGNTTTYDGKDTNVLFLMEYPIWYLESVENTSDNQKAICNLTESGLGINLYTKKIIKYEPEYYMNSSGTHFRGWKLTGDEVTEFSDTYLTVGSNPTDSNSSFIVAGSQTIDLNVSFKNSDKAIKIQVEGGRIILRDYLEATYAPEMVDGEELVVFGRKIRFDFPKSDSSGTITFKKDENVAHYVDKDGNDIQSNGYLKITDFCNASALLGNGSHCIQKLGYKTESSIISVPGRKVEEGTIKKMEDLAETRFAYLENGNVRIGLTMMFPGEQLGNIDYGTNGNADTKDKQRFYAVATTKGLFNSGLWDNWINVNNPDASLDWWNQYLKDNHFKYTVVHKEVNDYLISNYEYEIQQGEKPVLNLDVVAFIQEEMDDRAQTERSELLRTLFITLGWFLISYTILLVLAWILDTNVDLGIDLLNKLTLGNWYAIKNPEDIPAMDLSRTKYISAKGLIVSSIILIGVGIVLLRVDIMRLVIVLIDTFGSIAIKIEEIIKGK